MANDHKDRLDQYRIAEAELGMAKRALEAKILEVQAGLFGNTIVALAPDGNFQLEDENAIPPKKYSGYVLQLKEAIDKAGGWIPEHLRIAVSPGEPDTFHSIGGGTKLD